LPAWHNTPELILDGLAAIQAILEVQHDPDYPVVLLSQDASQLALATFQ
jgi:hypothetical protein